jgi:hypothetical protein
MSKLIVNCETGEIIERQLNKAEKDQQKIDELAVAQIKAELEAKETARITIAERIGLNADELKLLLG